MSRRNYLTHLQEYADSKEVIHDYGRDRNVLKHSIIKSRHIRRSNSAVIDGCHYHQTQPKHFDGGN